MVMTNKLCVWNEQRIFLKIVDYFLVAKSTSSAAQINGAFLVFYVRFHASS